MKLLAVCNLGIGTSLFLKLKLEAVLTEKGVAGVVENADAITAPSIQCDAIFTSQDLCERLSGSVSVPIYVVENFLDDKEVATKVEQFLSL